MNVEQVLAAIAVGDIDAAMEWYARLFGKSADRRPMSEAAEWQLLSGGGVQLVLAPDQAGKSMATISIAEIDDFVDELASRGIDAKATPPGDGPFRLVRIPDPDGNIITFAEPQ